MPGSDALYAPGKLTRSEPVLVPEPVIRILHEVRNIVQILGERSWLTERIPCRTELALAFGRRVVRLFLHA